MNKYYNLTDNERDVLFYKSQNINTPFGKKEIIYADFIGSCQPCPIIESYITKNIYPYYANTHSNAHNGMLMKHKIEKARRKIKQLCNVDESYKVLFCGNGTTACFNHLINIIDYHIYKKIIIFVSTFEHYSNYLPWLELSKSNCNITFEVIPISQNDYLLDLDFLKSKINDFLSQTDKNNSNLIICSITACSNVTGSIMPLKQIKSILDTYTETPYLKKLFFADFACSAPYVQIDGSIFDGLVFSGHKFHGGIGTPGVMIAKEYLFNKPVPHDTGGGCVCKCTSKEVVYEKDIEKRESAGTPNIIGIIKLERAMYLKHKLFENIRNNEKIICDMIKLKMNEFSKKYDNFVPILNNYNNDLIEHVTIFTFSLKNVHYNFLVVLLNDLFGIQSRGGVSCCGLLGEFIEKQFDVKGWCRISLHWTMSYDTIVKIFDCVEYVIANNSFYKNMYNYDEKKNLFYFSS